MKQNKRVEDYMKIIYRHRENDLVRSVDIAHELGVSKPTVSVALKNMEASGLVIFHPDMSIELTQEGERIAREVTERYNALYGLLTDLGVDDQTARDDACRMEHGISDRSLSALKGLRKQLEKGKFFNNELA